MGYHIYHEAEEHGLKWRLSEIWYPPQHEGDIGGELTAVPLADAEGKQIGLHENTKEYHAYITAHLTKGFSAHIDRSRKDYCWLIENEKGDMIEMGYAPTKDEAQIAVYHAWRVIEDVNKIVG